VWSQRRSHNRLALGAVLRPRVGAATATVSQGDKQVLAGRRDLRSGEGSLVLLVSGHRFTGATIDFLLSALRDADAAKCLFRKALSERSHPQPRVIHTDLAPIYSSAIPDSKKEGTLRNRCRHRPVQYLNTILEQDHRAIKRQVNAKQGFREFQAAGRTIQGYEAVHMIRKGQIRWMAGNDLLRQIKFIHHLFDLPA
jgi:DDE domain